MSTDSRSIIHQAITAIAPDVDPADADDADDVWYELDLDSMDRLNVLIAIGERTGIEIPEADAPGLLSMAELTAYLEGRLAEGASPAGGE